MKKLHLVIWAATAMMACNGFAQSVSEQLKVADCNYKILRKGEPVKVAKQMITLRATAQAGEILLSQSRGDFGSGVYGTGYRAYHIEFSYTGRRLEFSEIDTIEFYNDSELIYVIEVENRSRLMAESDIRTQQKVRYFSINLQGIPLIILDDVKVINLVE